MWYRRDGTPCDDLLEWAKDFEDPKKKIVRRTTLSNKTLISTVWLGLDHNVFGPKPLIFETMVFSPDDHGDHDMERYSTEAEAIEGHKRMVLKWAKKGSK